MAAARRHFDKARADYAQGLHREAIAELEAAHALDPAAKDPIFNLGVVHEKLSDIDDALQWFQLYTTMTLTPQERDRADAYIKRLEGGRRSWPSGHRALLLLPRPPRRPRLRTPGSHPSRRRPRPRSAGASMPRRSPRSA